MKTTFLQCAGSWGRQHIPESYYYSLAVIGIFWMPPNHCLVVRYPGEVGGFLAKASAKGISGKRRV